jgi:hypothetical protein
MTVPPTPKMCAACKRLLVWYQPVGQLALGRWIHPKSAPALHSPQPVPPDATLIGVCDFCCMHPPQWIYSTAAPTHTHGITIEAKGRKERQRFARDWAAIVQPARIAESWQSNYDEGWAACAECAPHIERRDMNRLITHVKATVDAFHRAAGRVPTSRSGYARQWKPFFDTVQPGRTPAPGTEQA